MRSTSFILRSAASAAKSKSGVRPRARLRSGFSVGDNLERIKRLTMETPKRSCSTCRNCVRYEDRHGFSFGPAEVSFECLVLDQHPDPIDTGEVSLTDEQMKALNEGVLGILVDCPMYTEKENDYGF